MNIESLTLILFWIFAGGIFLLALIGAIIVWVDARKQNGDE